MRRLLTDTERLHVVLMLTLCFATGVVDAVGYLGLDRVFTANMTGNVVVLAMGLTGNGSLPIVGPIVALAGFVVGAIIAGRVLRGAAAGWTGRDTGLLGIVAVLLAIAVVPTVSADAPYPTAVGLPVTGLLGLAMGMQGGAARHIAVADVPTVVVTSTLIGLSFDSWPGRRVQQRWPRRLLAIGLLGVGAVVGAALLLVHFWVGLSVAALVLVVVAAAGYAGQRLATSAAAADAARSDPSPRTS